MAMIAEVWLKTQSFQGHIHITCVLKSFTDWIWYMVTFLWYVMEIMA